MSNHLKIYRIILNTFGFQARPVGTFLLMQLRELIDASTRSLDRMLYPDYRNILIHT